MPKFTPQEKTIHDQFVTYGRNAKEWMRKCILLLPHIEKHKIWEKKGFDNIYDYARKLAGMSRCKVNESLRVLKKAEDKPELMRVIEQKGIAAVKPVITIATQETAKFWAEKANKMTKNTLEIYVKEIRKQEIQGQSFQSKNGLLEAKVDDFGLPRKPGQPEILEIKSNAPKQIFITMQLDPEIAEQMQKLKGQSDWNDLMKEFLKIREEHLNEQKPEIKKTEAGVEPSRAIPVAIKKYVIAKTNGQCAYPGCLKPGITYQHAQRWALENIHDPDQIFWLCQEHEQLAHLGLIENEEQQPQNWQIRQEPDQDNPKYEIDLIVQKFRNKTKPDI